MNASFYEKQNDTVIKQSRDWTTGDELFYSLCRPTQQKKKRPCLRCHKLFESAGHGNRMCAICARYVKDKGVRFA